MSSTDTHPDHTQDFIKHLRDLLDIVDVHRAAVQHVTEGGKSRRSMASNQGWAMVHAEYLSDLECLAEAARTIRFHSEPRMGGGEIVSMRGESPGTNAVLRDALNRLPPPSGDTPIAQ